MKSKAINVTIPDAMGSSDQSKLDELKTLNGEQLRQAISRR